MLSHNIQLRTNPQQPGPKKDELSRLLVTLILGLSLVLAVLWSLALTGPAKATGFLGRKLSPVASWPGDELAPALETASPTTYRLPLRTLEVLTTPEVLTGPVFSATGQNNGDYFGRSVALAGDVNGDGFADVIVGAEGYPSADRKGKVYLYQGSASGLSSSPAFSATGENNIDWFGWSVASAGDVNGDGYGDVIVGADGYPSGSGKGKVYMYLGSGTDSDAIFLPLILKN